MDQTTFKPGDQFAISIDDPMLGFGIAPLDDEQKVLKRLIERRHPEYEEALPHWTFCEQTYAGGREWFDSNVFKYIKEGEQEYADRVKRAYRFNHTKEVVDLLNKYLFKQVIARSDDAPDVVKQFWKRATRNKLDISQSMRQVSKKTSKTGRIGIVVDMPKLEATVVSRADEKKIDAVPYMYTVGPEQLLDYAYDELGELIWVLIAECQRDDEDPLSSSGEEDIVYRLWTRTDWRLFKVFREGRKKIVREIGNDVHDLGEVPVILADHNIGDEPYCAPGLIDDIAYLDRATGNYLSNLDAIIQDQSFSVLAMPAQNVLPGEDNYNKMVEMSTKRTFLYDGEGGIPPQFLSPDVKQAQLIVEVINKIINEIYHTVGLAGERTKQDNAMGIDNSSGVAKAYDFERVNALLSEKADALQVIENKIVRLVGKWAGLEIKQDFVSYPKNFDTRGLYDEFDIAARLMLVMAPDSVRREQMSTTIDKLFPQLAKDIKATMLAELKNWPPDLATMLAQPDGQALQGVANKGLAKASLSTPGTPGQGSVK